MKKIYSPIKGMALVLTLAASFTASKVSAQITTTTINTTGSMQTFTVPPCVTQVTVDARGAEGGDVSGNTVGWSQGPVNLSGGDGGRVQAVITVTPGEVLNIFIGAKGTTTAGGYNGGGNPGSGCSGTEVLWAGGGGASDIRRGGIALANRIIVAGGGGGAAGAANTYYSATNSGAGGGLTGAATTNVGGVACVNGTGGTQGAGGTGGNNSCWCGLGNVAGSGSLGFGGNGICAPSGLNSCGCNGTSCTSGGGGGGGYYGGGAGICFTSGSGGSSYTLPGAISFTHTQGFQTGNGLITIAYSAGGGQIVVSPASATVCNGASATLTASGVATYTWSNGSNSASIVVTPTANVSFTAQGTNSLGCISTSIIPITVNPTPTISVNSGSICSGQSFTMVGSGANSYTFQGGNAVVSPTATTSYTVVGTGTNGCVSNTFAVSNITVNATPTIIVNSGGICIGQSFTMVPSGANTYTFQGGNAVVSPTANANYTVVGTSSAGCVSQSAATSSVVVNTNPTITVNSGSICSGTSFTMVPSGANTYTFQGGNAVVSPTANTSYTVVGTNTAGCVSNTFATSNISVTASPSVSVTGNATICVGESTTLTASGANTYSWNTGASTSSVVVSPTVTTSYTATGTSSVTGCAGTTVVNLVVNPCTGINNQSAVLKGVSVYPNPSNGDFTIELKNGLNKVITVTDYTGKVVLNTTSAKDVINVSLATFANGIYNVKVESNNATQVIRVVKQ